MARRRPSSGDGPSGSGRAAALPSLPSWSPAAEVLDRDPSSLCGGDDGTADGSSAPRLAKDEAYAAAVLEAWREELAVRGGGAPSRSVASPLEYVCQSDDGTSLHGHVTRLPYIYQPPADGGGRETCLPGVVLFHTGAGPQDVFLRWRADSLVHDRETFGDEGCVVLIADILGDADGWAWRDRTRYDAVRRSVLVPDDNGQRKRLAGRVRAAIDAIKGQPGVDPERIGALGFCLGGHPIMELARMQDPAVKAMATFHGVFDGVSALSPVERSEDVSGCKVAVCTGEDDPFVPPGDLDAATTMFGDLGYACEALRFAGTRHGFTNPAQDYNPSDAFGYDEEACEKAWSAALDLLKRI